MREGYGDVIRRERIRKGLSQNKLSQLAGLSRRHLNTVEQGGNVSIGILRAVTQALGIPYLDLGGGLSVGVQEQGIPAAELLPIADGIEAGLRQVQRYATNLRLAARARAGRSVRKDPPSVEGLSQPAATLMELILEFTRRVESLTDRETILGLQRDVGELLDRSKSA
jgi:transcriptional regulator with XRE-family HTH domain